MKFYERQNNETLYEAAKEISVLILPVIFIPLPTARAECNYLV
jgi:hypothetical protein